jgi:hypothetical protein
MSQSPSTPKLTVVAGVACLAGGDTLVIGDGTYEEQLGAGAGGGSIAIPSGTAAAPTIVRAANRNKVILKPYAPTKFYVVEIYDGSWIVVDGIVADACTIQSYPYRLDGATSNVVLQNGTARNGTGTYSTGVALHSSGGGNVVRNMDSHNNGFSTCGGSTSSPDPAGHGIYIAGNNDIIENNRFYNNAYYGAQIYSGSGGVDDNIFRNNVIYGNRTGLVVGSGNNSEVYNNIIYNNGTAIALNYGATNAKLSNNTIYGNGGTCIANIQSTGSTARNNICYRNSSDSIYGSGGAVTASHNLFTDPWFNNAAAGDFSLRTGSLAIGTGMDLKSDFTTDIAGTARVGSWDIGAVKYSLVPSTESVAPPAKLRIVGQ